MASTALYNSGTTSQTTPLVGTERIPVDAGGAVVSTVTATQLASAPVPVTGALTAHAGGGQANATALTVGFNKVTVVASTNDSVQLPSAAAGLEVTVINATATQLALYGNAVDNAQINGAGAGAAYYIPGGGMAVVECTDGSNWYSQPQFGTVAAGGLLSATGAGFSNALALITDINTVGFALSDGGVLLPAELSAPAGSEIVVYNASGNRITIFAPGGATIDGTAGTTGVTLTVAHRGATFYKNVALKWVSSLFGAVSS